MLNPEINRVININSDKPTDCLEQWKTLKYFSIKFSNK